MYRRARRLFSIYAAWHLPDVVTRPRLARLRLLPGFVWAGARVLPQALRWLRLRDPVARAQVKRALGLHGRDTRFFDSRLFDPAPRPAPLRNLRPAPGAPGVTLVMPVHTPVGGDLPLLRRALDCVAAHTDIPWRIVLVEDASPDAATRPFLRQWARTQPAHLIENGDNLGFVGSVNRGLDLARTWDDPVVLLNSDALLPPGWAARLLRPLREDAMVGSVTPLSNDAELGSVPMAGRASPITPEAALAIDAVAQRLNGRAAVPAVAGVGFCMALSRAALDVAPRLDDAFSPGYGEEVDWCQKTAAQGFSHLYAPDLYVAHIGGQSFGQATKQALIQRNSVLLSQRYPDFDTQVHGFLRRDPLASARLALGLARAEALRRAPLPVYLGHAMGGGADTDLLRRVRRDLGRVGAALVIRVGGPCRYSLELWDEAAPDAPAVSVQSADSAVIARLLDPVTQRDLVYSCGVGDSDPVTLPDLMLSLRRPGDGLTVLMHDYFPLSPNHVLLEEGDQWRGLPDPARASARHETRRPDGAAVPLSVWRVHWGRLVYAADRVICFCAASQALVQQAYPGAMTQVCPHDLPVAVPALPHPGGRPVLGVLGNIAPHKGARVVSALSRILARTSARTSARGSGLGSGRGSGRGSGLGSGRSLGRGFAGQGASQGASRGAGLGAGLGQDCDLVLLGDLDPAYGLHPPAHLHGAYAVQDLPALAARYGVTCWLIPSLWPETFSFTTHEALATGLPVMVFDLGGQAEALRAALARGAGGALLPLDWAEDPQAILALAGQLSLRRVAA